MKNTLLFFSCAYLLIFSVACHKSSSSTARTTHTPVTIGVPIQLPDTSVGPTIIPDSFPLATGHVWHYMQQIQYARFINSDSTIYERIDTAYFTISTLADTFVGGIRFTKMGDGASRSYTSTFSFLQPYNYSDTGLGFCYYVTDSNGLHVLPDLHKTDRAFIHDSSQLVLKLPAADLDWWQEGTWNTNTAVPLYATWSGFYKVSLAAGTFNCMRVQSSVANQGVGYSNERFFSTKGLIFSVDRRYGGTASTSLDSANTTTCIVSLIDVNF